MKFALINDERKEASKGARGFCPTCKNEVFAKCGDYRVDHWAHKGKLDCDPWKESETEWHRMWKSCFRKEWQEVNHIAADGEIHRADIKTDKGFVIEIQHSSIKVEEMKSREAFYKDMVWVVDATRLSRDYKRFCKAMVSELSGLGWKDFDSPIWKKIYHTDFPEEFFPKRWRTSSVPVYFDFQGMVPDDQLDENSSFLWVLFPGNPDDWIMEFSKIKRKDFIELSSQAPHLLLAQDICSLMEERNKKRRAEEEAQAEMIKWREKQRVDPLQQLLINSRRGRFRRF